MSVYSCQQANPPRREGDFSRGKTSVMKFYLPLLCKLIVNLYSQRSVHLVVNGWHLYVVWKPKGHLLEWTHVFYFMWLVSRNQISHNTYPTTLLHQLYFAERLQLWGV